MILFKNALYLGKTVDLLVTEMQKKMRNTVLFSMKRTAFAARIEIIVRITATRGDVSSSLRKT